MKKKTFVSTADALAYVIKRIDGTTATISDEENNNEESDQVSATKTLVVETNSIYSYWSQFTMEVPADAPNFQNFKDVILYLDSIGKIPHVDENYSPSINDVEDMKQYIIKIRGIFCGHERIVSFLIVNFSSDPISADEVVGMEIEAFGLEQQMNTARYAYNGVYSYNINDSFDMDNIYYANDFEISAE